MQRATLMLTFLDFTALCGVFHCELLGLRLMVINKTRGRLSPHRCHQFVFRAGLLFFYVLPQIKKRQGAGDCRGVSERNSCLRRLASGSLCPVFVTAARRQAGRWPVNTSRLKLTNSLNLS